MQGDQNNAQVILALDVGGSFIKSALFRDGELLEERPLSPSHSGGSAGEIAGALREAARGTYNVLGIAIPGPFDYRRGVSWMEHKFGSIKGRNLKEFLPDVPVRFVHDANAFLLGEWKGERRMGAVMLGTGLGVAAVIDGELRVNEFGSPAEEVRLWDKPFRGTTAEQALDLRNHGPGQPPEKWDRFGGLLAEILTPWHEKLRLERIVIGGQIANDFEHFKHALKHLPVFHSTKGNHAVLYGVESIWRRGNHDHP